MNKPSLIVIGASAGGVTALQELFLSLGRKLSTPMVVVMHVPHATHIQFDLVFSGFPGKVVEVRDKTPLEPGHVYFAPPDYHVLVEKDRTLSLSQDEEVWFARPSIDVLFESASVALGSEVCGILLTGANQDGARGLQLIHEAGGLAWVQDPATAQNPVMPESAMQLFRPDAVLSLPQVAAELIRGEKQL